jgi:general secretion pathway protein L
MMPMMATITAFFHEWIAAVAKAVNFVLRRYAPRRHVLLTEGRDQTFMASLKSARKGPALPDVSFRLSHGRPDPALPGEWETALRGARVEAVMASNRVLFRSLDFPKQAVDFLDGMIRTQIDRLTPWSTDDVMFGWSPPSAAPNERVELTLAATSKDEVQPACSVCDQHGSGIDRCIHRASDRSRHLREDQAVRSTTARSWRPRHGPAASLADDIAFHGSSRGGIDDDRHLCR